MPAQHSLRGFLSDRYRLCLTFGTLAAVIDASLMLYGERSVIARSSVRPSISPTALDSHPNSSTQPTAIKGLAATRKPTVPKVELQYTLTSASSSFHSLAISPDGKTLVSSSNYSNVKVWDLSKGCTGKTCSTPIHILPTSSLLILYSKITSLLG